MASFKSAGIKLFYEETGRGHPLLFLHEFGGDARAWEQQVRHFSRRYRCIVTAARGYPPSDVPDDENAYGWEQSLSDAVAVLDHLKIDRAHVIGLSMGAYTGLMMALRHGERVSALVAASGGSGAHLPTRDNFIEETLKAAGQILKESRVPADDIARRPNRIQLKYKDPREWEKFRDHLSQHPGIGSGYTLRHVQAARPSLHDFKAELGSVSAPTLLLVGDEDEACLDINLWLKRTMPMAGLVVIPKSGHLLNLEEPARFNTLCGDFFTAAENGRWRKRDEATASDRVYTHGDGVGEE
ncbi:MAG: alpha/beta hydrolase [Alphaproteobacteria bacterium]|nr:alpha/beta hydrolase [Alphaproteobacteria bacterium]